MLIKSYPGGAAVNGSLFVTFLITFLLITFSVPASKSFIRLTGVLALASLTYALQLASSEWIANPHWRSAIVPLLWIQFMSASELVLVRRAGFAPSSASPAARTYESLMLLWKLRRIGTRWQVRNSPHPPESRVAFILKRSLKILVAYQVLSLMTQAPPPDPNFVGRDKQALAFQGLVRLSQADITFRIIGTLSFWACTALINLLMFEIACLGFVVVFLCKVEDCPPLYGDFSSASTIRGFWGTAWHQCLRSGLTGHADVIEHHIFPFRQRLVSRYLRIFISFFISGLIHHTSDMAMGMTAENVGAFTFFLLQPIGIIAEDAIQAISKQVPLCRSASRVRVFVGYLWVLVFLVWSTPTWFYPQQRLGLDASGLLPFHPNLLKQWNLHSNFH
ncbi:cytochrome P450 monooxygenase [Colletotrichum abscissum]